MSEENDTTAQTPLEEAQSLVGSEEEVRTAAAANEAKVQNAVFPYAQTLAEDTVALRDDLTKVQSNATEAARLSGDHFSRLLYGPDVDRHLSPYGVPPVPNSLDSRKP